MEILSINLSTPSFLYSSKPPTTERELEKLEYFFAIVQQPYLKESVLIRSSPVKTPSSSEFLMKKKKMGCSDIREKMSILQLNERLQDSAEVVVGSNKHLLHLGTNPEADQETSKSPDLTEDLIIEILTKLPVKSLNRFMWVCKHWYNLITSPQFIAKHREINPKKAAISAYCCSIRPKTGRPPATISFRFNDVPKVLTLPLQVEKMKIVGASEGVVCLSLTEEEDRFVLWNPAINRPPSSKAVFKDFCTCGFFFDPIANTFKVVRVVFLYNYKKPNRKRNVAQVSVFSLTDNSWRYTEVNIPFQLWGSYNPSITGVVCVKRYMYWVIGLCSQYTCDEAFILCFDMLAESFTKMKTPHCETLECKRIAPYQESLAFIIHRGHVTRKNGNFRTWYEVWVMNDHDQPSWSRLTFFSPPMLLDCDLGFIRKGDVDWVVFTSFNDKNRFLYNPRTGESKKISGEDEKFQSFSYSEDIVSSLMMATKQRFL